MKQTKTIKLLIALTILSLQMTYVLIGQTYQNTYEYDDAGNRVKVNSPIMCDGEPCDCENVNTTDWLTLDTEANTESNTDPSEGCLNDECTLTYKLDIPDEYKCFAYYQISLDGGATKTSQDKKYFGSNNQIPELSKYCFQDGETLNVKLYLYSQLSQEDALCTLDVQATCDINCCDLISVEFTKDANSCCFTPTIINNNPICGVPYTIEYSSANGVITPEANGDICVGIDERFVDYTITIDGECTSTKTAELECDCSCPTDEEAEGWVDVSLSKEESPCGAEQCKVSVMLDIPTEKSGCFTEYELDYIVRDKDGDGTPIGHSVPRIPLPLDNDITGSIPCINSGETIQVAVRLYNANGEKCTIYSNEAYCEKRDAVPLPEPCTPDYANDGWTHNTETLIISINGCKYAVNYAYRTTEDTDTGKKTQDIQITSLGEVSGPCSNVNDEDLFRRALTDAITQIVKTDKDYKPQVEDGCVDIWRVIQHSCWNTYTLTEPNIDPQAPVEYYKFKVPCTSDCCTRQLRVCNRKGIGITVEDIGFATGSSNFNCSEDAVIEYLPTIIISQTGCEDKDCDIYDDMDEIGYDVPDKDKYLGNSGPPKVRINAEIIKNELKEAKRLFRYRTEITESTFGLIIGNTELSNITLNIYDLYGQLLLSTDESLTGAYQMISKDISNLSSGTYVFNISSDGKKLGTGKFQIVK